MKINRINKIVTLFEGNFNKYAPKIPDMAPLAPISGITECGFIIYCAKVAASPHSKKKNIYLFDAKKILQDYPKKADKKTSLRSICKLLKAGITKEQLIQARDNYKALIEREQIETQYIIQSNNFLSINCTDTIAINHFTKIVPHESPDIEFPGNNTCAPTVDNATFIQSHQSAKSTLNIATIYVGRY